MPKQDGDYYELLAVAHNATQEEIKKAWRKKAFEYHPDRGGSDEMMFKINWAYQQLSNPETRRNYDTANAYQHHDSNEKKKQKDETPEDYTDAIFVDGIESKDKSSSVRYVKRGEYVYYPVAFKNKILFWQYKDVEYYRAVVKKVYSRKQNNFRITPLFVVEIEGFQQIIFSDDYAKHWYSQDTFMHRERVKALQSLAVWIVCISIVIYLIR